MVFVSLESNIFYISYLMFDIFKFIVIKNIILKRMEFEKVENITNE